MLAPEPCRCVLARIPSSPPPKITKQLCPQGQNRSTPPKKQRGPCASPSSELIELGEILDDLIYQTTEKKPAVQHVTMKQKEAYARMKQIQDKEFQQYKENVRDVRRTAAGEVLLQMSKTADNTFSKLHHAVQKALGETANVTVISDKVRLEIRDLPEWATAEDVTLAVRKHIEGDLPVESAPKLRKGYRGTQVASMFLTKAMADTLLAMRDIRIGWALCSIRSTVDPRRCYKCLEFGPTAARCRSKHDASKKCFNCGGEGHSSKDCTNTSSCILCARAGAQNTGHHTLSKGCPLAAQDLLKQTVRENAIDIAILCEPYSAKQDGSWLQNHRTGAAIWNCGNPASQLREQSVSRGFVREREANAGSPSIGGEVIADTRRQCLVARRRQQRSRERPNFLQLLENYREKRAILKKAIKRSKALCWENLCAEADEQPFGTAYKVVMGKLARRPMPMDPEQLLDIVTTLFPEHPATNLAADIHNLNLSTQHLELKTERNRSDEIIFAPKHSLKLKFEI
ncbi:hypothetical protein ACLKA6_015997 [Drosophila palustris]